MEAVERMVLSNDWITGILLLSLLCMVFAKELFYNRFLNFIILPFNNKYIFPQVLEANEPLQRARDLVLKRGSSGEEVKAHLERARQHYLLAGNRQLQELVDYEFTAQMEDFLDAISREESGHLEYVRNFFFGSENDAIGQPGLRQ